MSKCLQQAWRVLHQPRVYFTVEPVLLVFMFAQFLSYSALQVFLHTRICDGNANCTIRHTNSTPCSNISDSVQEQLQEDTSHWILYINVVTGLPTVLLSVIYGSTSDIVGRRLFIALPTVGALLNTAVILLVIYIPSTPLYVLLVGALCTGVYGNYSVLNFAAYSYVSDVSASPGRTRQIGILESMTYLGATLSLLIGGVWAQKTDSFLGPFWCIFGCYICVLLYTTVALPESLHLNTHSNRRSRLSGQVQYYHGNNYNSKLRKCGRHMKAVGVNLLQFLKLLFTNWKLAVLIITFFVVEINFLGITDVVIIYSLGKPLCWNFDLVGYFLAAKVLMNGAACLLILPILAYFKVHDSIIVLVGLISGAAALVTMGVATQNWTMYIGEFLLITAPLTHYKVTLIAKFSTCKVPCCNVVITRCFTLHYMCTIAVHS